jgi:AraC-like DNA-binding protein
MDELARFLDGPRARGAFLLCAVFDPPWSLRIQDEAPLTIMAVTRGAVAVRPAGGAVTALRPGDVAVVRGPDPYIVCDPPDTAPKVVIHPGQQCATLAGEPLGSVMELGTRTWGTGLDGGTAMVVGTYEEADELSHRLLDALPPLVVVRAEQWDDPLVDLLCDEIPRDEPGQSVVLDRLLDLLLIKTLRIWFAGLDAEAVPAWFRAQHDAVVGRALRLLQGDPARPWTVASLAAEVGVSRAALARRFTDLVGEPPMAFLTNWRLALAADRLTDPGTTIEAVAREVGYASAFALSAAFKRVRGISPSEHRAAARRPA